MYVMCGTVIAHDPKLCPIVFGSDVIFAVKACKHNISMLLAMLF